MCRTWGQALGGVVLMLLLVDCGDGGGTKGKVVDPVVDPILTATGTLSGTAAAGNPLAGRVTVKDSLGAIKTVDLAGNGGYTIDVTGMTPPFVLRAEGTAGGHTYTLHSAATMADVNGTINITPFTDLIIGNIARQVAANYFDTGNVTGLTAAQLDAAENELQQRLQGVLTDLGVPASIDLLRTAFSPNHAGIDAALDVLRVTVDNTANTATIVNVLNNAAITDDLTASDTGVIDSTGTQSYASDWAAILARFASVETAFAKGLPAANDPLLRAQFDQSGFLDSGIYLDEFIAGLTSDPGNVGLKFASITLIRLTPATAAANGRATVNLGTGDATYGIYYFDIDMTGILDSVGGGTNWVIAGNQQIADTSAEMRSIMVADSAQIVSGIDFDSDIHPAGSEIDYAVVTGPGLPTSGGGADGLSAGVLLVVAGRGADAYLYMAASPYAGSNTPPHPRDRYDVYSWTDQEIAALPSDNLTYTETFYSDTAGTPDNFADDDELAAYSFTLLKPPLPAGSLSAANFPVITAPSVTFALGVYAVGGPLTVTWNIPAGLAMESAERLRFYSTGFDEDDGAGLSPTATSHTFQISAPTGTVTGGWLSVVAADFYNRNYTYHYPLRIQ